MAAIDGAAWFDYLKWKQSQRERPLPRSHGLYCSHCQHSHPYNGSEGVRLAVRFEKRKDKWHVLWLCPRSFDQLAEDIPPPSAPSTILRRRW
jgi:hypothetical protein